jgi:hypothetical protein
MHTHTHTHTHTLPLQFQLLPLCFCLLFFVSLSFRHTTILHLSGVVHMRLQHVSSLSHSNKPICTSCCRIFFFITLTHKQKCVYFSVPSLMDDLVGCRTPKAHTCMQDPKCTCMQYPKSTCMHNPKRICMDNPKCTRMQNAKSTCMQNPKGTCIRDVIINGGPSALSASISPLLEYLDKDYSAEVRRYVYAVSLLSLVKCAGACMQSLFCLLWSAQVRVCSLSFVSCEVRRCVYAVSLVKWQTSAQSMAHVFVCTYAHITQAIMHHRCITLLQHNTYTCTYLQVHRQSCGSFYHALACSRRFSSTPYASRRACNSSHTSVFP